MTSPRANHVLSARAAALSSAGALLAGLAGCSNDPGRTLDPLAAIYLGAAVLLLAFIGAAALLARLCRGRGGTDGPSGWAGDAGGSVNEAGDGGDGGCGDGGGGN